MNKTSLSGKIICFKMYTYYEILF